MRDATYTIKLKDGESVVLDYWSFHKTDICMGLYGSRTAAYARGDHEAARRFEMRIVILATGIEDPKKLADLVKEDMGNYKLLLDGIEKHEGERLDKQLGTNDEDSDSTEGNAPGGG